MSRPNAGMIALVMLLMTMIGGCAIDPVQPWERGRLAQRKMAIEADPLLAAFRRHTHFSKEGSSAQLSAAGGGCGCN